MSNVKKPKTIKKPKKLWLKILLIVASMIIALLVLLAISPLGGNIKFYKAWIDCGHKPLSTAGSGYLNDGVDHYYEPDDFSLIQPTLGYFCTALDAEKHGYSADSHTYIFPEIHKKYGDMYCIGPNDPQSETIAQFSRCD